MDYNHITQLFDDLKKYITYIPYGKICTCNIYYLNDEYDTDYTYEYSGLDIPDNGDRAAGRSVGNDARALPSLAAAVPAVLLIRSERHRDAELRAGLSRP